MGDRFAHQAHAQLQACILAGEAGVDIVPVWNKSNREHTTIGSEPASVRAAADEAVKALGWNKPYHIDADHINLTTVDRFVGSSDFFTIDVASSIGKAADAGAVSDFVRRHPEVTRSIDIPGIDSQFSIAAEEVARIARQYLLAVDEAGKMMPARCRISCEGIRK